MVAESKGLRFIVLVASIPKRTGNLHGTRDSPLLGKDELFHDEEVEWVHQALSVLKARVLAENLGS